MHAEIRGSQDYKERLRRFATSIRNELIELGHRSLPTHSASLTLAFEHIIHSLAHVASYPGKYEYVSMSRRHEPYGHKGRYQHLMRPMVMLAVDLLKDVVIPDARSALVTFKNGYQDGKTNERVSSRIKATLELENRMIEAGLVWETFPNDPKPNNRPGLLYIKDRLDRLNALDREPTQLESFIPAQSLLIKKGKVSLTLPNYKAYEKLWHFKPDYPKVHRGRTSLYRQFKHDELSGGRIGGHWVQNCPKSLRPYVTFKGEPACEMDYQAAQPCFAYSLINAVKPPGDPYLIPSYDETYRDLFKWVFTTGIGIGSDQNPEQAFNVAIIKAGIAPKAGLADKLIDAFWSRHEKLSSHFFQTDAWRRLQLFESEIALTIMGDMAKQNVPVIPIHDSFICQVAHADKLFNAMTSAVGSLSSPPKVKVVFGNGLEHYSMLN